MTPQIPTIAFLLVTMLFALSACEVERESGRSAPQDFLGANTKLLSQDMVEVTVGVLRPTPGAMQAYADCVGSQYALIRGMDFARRVSSRRFGNGDVLTDHITYLISPVRPAGDFVLNAREVVARCQAEKVPTF